MESREKDPSFRDAGSQASGVEIMDRNVRITTLALFIAAAVALHWIESFIPRPAPFLRFGLANIMTLCTLYAFGGPWALFVAAVRVIIGSALLGSIFSPAFALSLAGGLAAGITMWIMPRSLFSPIGISVGGAAAHMLAQFVLAGMLIAHRSLMHIFPVFLLVSVLTGMINGYVVIMIIRVVEGRRNRISSPLLS